MINNSNLKIPLLITCIGVWGYVFFNYFYTSNHNVQNSTYVPIQINIEELEDFELALDYKDPFLSNNIGKKKNISFAPPKISTVNVAVPKSMIDMQKDKNEVKNKKPVVFPNITYKGFVDGNHSSKSALVQIDNKSHQWELGKSIMDMRLHEIALDSIRIYKEGTFKTIKR